MDLHDPYSPPRTRTLQPRARRAPAPREPGDLDLGRCLSEAWEGMRARPGSVVASTTVWCVATSLATLTVVGTFVVGPVLTWSFAFLSLRHMEGGGSWRQVFVGFRDYGAVLVRSLTVTVAQMALGLLAFSPLFLSLLVDGIDLELWALALTAGLVVGLHARLLPSTFLMVDPGLSGLQALRESWRLTARQPWRWVALTLLCYGVAFLTVAAFPWYDSLRTLLPLVLLVAWTWLVCASAHVQVRP